MSLQSLRKIIRVRKTKRKDKDSSTPPAPEEARQYLEEGCVREKVTDADFYKLVALPPSVDYNEWLATHSISFFNHVNLMYGVISEYCTSESCSMMTGPGNVQFLWHDDKGKKCKYTAPEYVDYITTYVQKQLSDETLYPTKFGQPFPNMFEATTKKLHRLLFHVLAHMFHAHYSDCVVLGIHGYLNSLFTHFMVFNIKFELMEDKETEVLQDLLEALVKQLPDPNQNEGKETSEVTRS